MVVRVQRAHAHKANPAKVVGIGVLRSQRFTVASSSLSKPLGTKLTPW